MSQKIEHYLNEYCSKSLIQLTIKYNEYCQSLNARVQFSNIEFLCFEQCRFKHELSINYTFPNVRILKLGFNNYYYPSMIRVHLPALIELFFFDTNNVYGKKFQEDDIDELLKLNPQLEKLGLYLCNKYDPKLIQNVKGNCPNLRHFELYCRDSNFNDIKRMPIHFDRIETLGIYYSNCNFSYLNDNQVRMRPFAISMIPSKYHHPMVSKRQLTSFKLLLDYDYEFAIELFENESILSNIEDLRIILPYTYYFCFEIPSDSIIRFLKQNRGLKTFSLIAPYKLMKDQFYDLITSINDEFKI